VYVHDILGNSINSKNVQIFACDEFKWVNIDSIDIATRRGFLTMMVLMNIRVQSSYMQGFVELLHTSIYMNPTHIHLNKHLNTI